jgi:hypothetical protein
VAEGAAWRLSGHSLITIHERSFRRNVLVTRRRRILVELLGPPLVATIVMAFFALVGGLAQGTLPGWQFWGGALVVLAGAFVVAAVPCVLFTIVLEIAFAVGLDPASWWTVLLAAGLGLLSGMAIVGFNPSYGAFEGLALIGTATGATLGFIVSTASKPRPTSPSTLGGPV